MADLHCRIMWLSPHPSGVSFLFAIQNVWETATMVNKIAYHSCTACHPAIVLRLSLADTISSATVYIKALHTWQKHSKFYCHVCRTMARQTKNQLIWLLLQQLANVMFPRLHCTAELFVKQLKLASSPNIKLIKLINPLNPKYTFDNIMLRSGSTSVWDRGRWVGSPTGWCAHGNC